MTLRNVIRRNEALIAESSVIFRTSLGNGLCIREHDRETNRDKFFTCEDPEFKKENRRDTEDTGKTCWLSRIYGSDDKIYSDSV